MKFRLHWSNGGMLEYFTKPWMVKSRTEVHLTDNTCFIILPFIHVISRLPKKVVGGFTVITEMRRP